MPAAPVILYATSIGRDTAPTTPGKNRRNAERPYLVKDTGRHPEPGAALRGRPGALRPVRRLLPALPRPDADLQLRLLRARRHDTRGSPDRQDRPVPRQARTAAGHDI